MGEPIPLPGAVSEGSQPGASAGHTPGRRRASSLLLGRVWAVHPAPTTRPGQEKPREQRPARRLFQERHALLRALEDSPELLESDLFCAASGAGPATVGDNYQKANFTSINGGPLTLRR